ncbi:cell division topological specificity factor [Thermosyntropha lipolytica DSM 11003]|uniref:Cell division topological specificity factor n=1 Tax=Thermosyntropha lipolytica DSM 11003 TaxID=1123382 RepID=A0A1M5N361_9FIRM|nr:cell division topological specificity factor MinE [Thermosyntropha lipolytica]SHG84008.1 cell division topological specificity factor [Thermosyntropha lipolytica DSM 11003]
MIDFLKKIYARENSSSRDKANERLRIVLAHDRTGTSTHLIEVLKEEIIEVIKKHVEIDGTPEVTIVHEGRQSALDINIPLKGR